jgi:ATP-binding cassette subfamily F protein 3
VLGHNVKAGYYSQYRVDMLKPHHTILEEAFDTPQRLTEQFVRTLLGCFLFSGDDVFKKVDVLSGGEKSRLALVKILLDPPNLLLMDEPTTHLDMSSIDALAFALDQFQGTLIFISHDVYFIRALANHVVHVNAGQLTHYPGGYQYYLDKTKALSARAALTAGGREGQVSGVKGGKSQGSSGKGSASGHLTHDTRHLSHDTHHPVPAANQLSRKDQKRLEAQQRQASSHKRKAQQQIVHTLEKEIQTLEARQAAILAELELAETYEKPGRAQELNRELGHLQHDLAELNPKWEEQATRLAALE